ncbi:hypothetical protein ACFFX0_31830 [Citricoccus parietis]|uniref:Uncharacterized protein n=1 Tax=Citricoccus parietis TaxID=592307 RepID=A0ABV5G966_9MICC
MLQRPRATRPWPSRVVMRLTLKSAPTRSSGSDSGYRGDRQLGLRRAHGVLRSFRDVRYSPRASLRCATGTPRQQQAGWRLQARTISPRLTMHPQSAHDISMRSGYRTASRPRRDSHMPQAATAKILVAVCKTALHPCGPVRHRRAAP